MFFLMLALYFGVSCFLAWVFFFPSGRELIFASLTQFVTQIGSRIEQGYTRLETGAANKSASLQFNIKSMAGELIGSMRRQYRLYSVFVCIVVVPSVIAIWLSGQSRLDGYASSTYEVNLQIAELLKGEQLVAPAALPPAFFSTKEVLLERPMLVSASRNWDLLSANYRQRLLMVFKIMKEKYGYEMALIEGYRSPERQNMLAELGAQVTNAKAFQSYHQYGLAADCAFIREGKLLISERDAWAMRGYELYGEVAESFGLNWGGRWKMMDFGHTELTQPEVLKK
ncbi:MAG: M15 family metallopeptidase [Pseudomonadota bacterium]